MTLTSYVVYLMVACLISFFCYAIDKKRAERGAWRISEATLLGISFLGGALGGYSAMFLTRHKTKKWYFHLVHIIGLCWQVSLLVFLINNPDILF